MEDIFKRMRNGELILESDAEYPKLYAAFTESMRIAEELNGGHHTPDEVCFSGSGREPLFCPA